MTCPDCSENGGDGRRCLIHEKEHCQRTIDINQKRIDEIEEIMKGKKDEG